MNIIDTIIEDTASPIVDQEVVIGPAAEFEFAVVEAEVVEAVVVLEEVTGLADEVLVTTAIDELADDTDAPVVAGMEAAVEAAKLTPLILRETPALPHSCCANCTVANTRSTSTN